MNSYLRPTLALYLDNASLTTVCCGVMTISMGGDTLAERLGLALHTSSLVAVRRSQRRRPSTGT